MTELFEECRRVGVPVPDLSPGDRSNYNRGKELQLQLEQVVSSRKREGGVDGSKTRQAGMSKDSVFASVEPTFKGKAVYRKIECRRPSTTLTRPRFQVENHILRYASSLLSSLDFDRWNSTSRPKMPGRGANSA